MLMCCSPGGQTERWAAIVLAPPLPRQVTSRGLNGPAPFFLLFVFLFFSFLKPEIKD